MTNEEFRNSVRKLGKLLTAKNGRGYVTFDPSSYDDINDIPVLLYQGVPYMVDSVQIDPKRDEMTVNLAEGPYSSIMFNIEETDNENDPDFDQENLAEIIRETYFGTEESWEIGDFEDFIMADIKEFI